MAKPGRLVDDVSSVDITTDNLQLSTEFYTEILGGKLLSQWNDSFRGNDLCQRIFGKELEEAAAREVDPTTRGVPLLCDTGNYQVSWNFILFDNFIVKLVQYSTEDGTILSLRDERTSPAIVPSPHLCFWVQDVDINEYIRAVENVAAERKMTKVFFNRAVAVESEADRAAVPMNQLASYIKDGPFSPFKMAYFKGPGGEQLELFQLKDSLARDWGKALSAIGSPSTAYMTGYADNKIKSCVGLTAKLFGMHHIGIRVVDIERSVEFYSKVLGGEVMQFQGDDMGGEAMLNAVFQKEILEAKTLGRSREDMFIPDVIGRMSAAVRFVQVGTATIELVGYFEGKGDSRKKYSPRLDWTSPAYCNTMALIFNVQGGADFNQFLVDIEKEAAAQGFPEFIVNKSPSVDEIGAFRSRGIHGYQYALARGPSGEHLGFCQFPEACREILHGEIQDYGGVSSMFADLNPTIKLSS